LYARSIESGERIQSHKTQEVCQGEEEAEDKEIRNLAEHILRRKS
jgi:hypothetical protein